MQPKDKKALQDIADYLQCLMTKGMEKAESKIPQLEATGGSEELTELFNVFGRFSTMLHTAYDFQKRIAAGELAAEVDLTNFLAMPLRSLQSSLRHLTWQASQVAKGDLNQHVHFLGDFSESFNFMIAALKEKELLQAKLQRAQKMEAIGIMASGVAHDLNNILSGIVGYPELLLLQLPESSELRKPIEEIQESGKRAANVVADLLTVARGAASTREMVDINVLIHEYLTSPECKKLKSLHPGVVCTELLDAEFPTISCSPMHIKKIVMNLTINAAEAIADKGNILISTSNQQLEKAKLLEHGMKSDNYVVLTIQDDGPGISDKDLEHIFEPFYSKKVLGKSGTGLGLAIVWNTVQDHNGRIFVDSNEKGTRFQLYFPMSKKEKVVQSKYEKTEKLTGTNESILVVDDEPQLRDIASQMLQSLGYKVDSVCSGELAIEFIKATPVDLIMIDMIMEPGINGRQTYEKIIKLYPDQKAIIASGFSGSDDVKATLQSGAGGFIKKPYSIGQLGRAVKKALKN